MIAWTRARHQANVEARQAKMREVHLKLQYAQWAQRPGARACLQAEAGHAQRWAAQPGYGVSRCTLNEEVDEHGERKVELRRNNPYLHDNVD